MPIKFRCVHCGQFLGISRTKAGTVVDCPTCGRSVGVPQKDGQAEPVARPSLNHEDSELADALREVAAIAQSSEIAIPQIPSQDPRQSSDVRETREVHGPPPQLIEAEPLSPAEPIEPDVTLPAEPSRRQPADLPDPDETQYEKAPLEELARLAVEEPEPPAELHRSTKTESPAFPYTNEVPWRLWLAFVIFGFVAILGGYLIGHWDASSPQMESQDKADASKDVENPAPVVKDPDLAARFGEFAILGKVEFSEGDGNELQPDAGAWVYAFPVDKQGTENIPADWLAEAAPSQYGTGHDLIVAALRVFGGNASVAKDDGTFEIRVADPGVYLILACSGQSASDHQTLLPGLEKTLESYFEDPAAFLDNRPHAYSMSTEVREAKTEVNLDPITP